MPFIDPTASIAPGAIVTGDVTLGPGARVLAAAVLAGGHGAIVLGENVLVMENAVLRGRPGSPLTIGDSVLVGPHTHLNGATIEDEVFVATGASVFANAVAGARSELRINSVLHVNSVLPPDSVVPIGWIAAGNPAQLFPPTSTSSYGKSSSTSAFPRPCTGSLAAPRCVKSCSARASSTGPAETCPTGPIPGQRRRSAADRSAQRVCSHCPQSLRDRDRSPRRPGRRTGRVN